MRMRLSRSANSCSSVLPAPSGPGYSSSAEWRRRRRPRRPARADRLDGFSERIIALYARGMNTRDIRAHLRETYGVEVSRAVISRATDAVVHELAECQARPLDAVYP